ncbi:MAG: DUF3370 domain-containing protein [Sandaracinaceae bacterium]|nr:DUF3370 domain-containing protein [Sandaracinaceae bacterium]
MSGPMRRALFVLLVLQSGCPETDRESLLDQSWIDAAWPDGAAIEPDAFDLDAFDALDADRDAPSVDAPSLDGSSIDTPSIDAPSVDAALGPEIGVDRWSAGLIAGTPLRDELLALPGGGVGGPVLTSNNPEIFTGEGLLYGNARPSPTRGGEAYELSGDFGVYLHHVNQSGARAFVWLLVTNPGASDVTVSAEGSGYDQTETGGLGLGSSPDYHVSAEWIRGTPDTIVTTTSLASARPLVIYREDVNDRAELDGRFAIHTSAPVYVYVVTTSIDDVNEAIRLSRTDAPGDYRVSGRPPPPYGRECGIYAHDTWAARFDVAVPSGPSHVGFVLNTATGTGFAQVQAFPALALDDESAAEAVGMYGNVYDLEVGLVHDGVGGSRHVRVVFHSLASGAASRYWDGLSLVDGREVVVRHVPGSVSTTLAELDLAPGASTRVRFRAMVPGLASIPQALTIESE